MPKVRFYPKPEENRDGLHLVLLKYFAPPRQLVMSTGVHVGLKDWNDNQQRVRKTDPNAENKNKILDTWSADIEASVLALKANKKTVTVESIRAALEKDPARQKAADIAAFCRSHFAGKKSRSVYNNLASQVDGFTRSTRRGRTFEELTPVWFSEFREYMKEKKLADTYTARALVALKTAVRQAAITGVTQNTSILICPIDISFF